MPTQHTEMGESTIDASRAALRNILTFPREEVLKVLGAIGYPGEGGVPLSRQVEEYGKFLGPWTEPRSQAGIESRERAIVASIECGTTTLRKLSGSTNLEDLQKHIVILNVNEFLLRQNPTREEFSRLVTDFKDWTARIASTKTPELTSQLSI